MVTRPVVRTALSLPPIEVLPPADPARGIRLQNRTTIKWLDTPDTQLWCPVVLLHNRSPVFYFFFVSGQLQIALLTCQAPKLSRLPGFDVSLPPRGVHSSSRLAMCRSLGTTTLPGPYIYSHLGTSPSCTRCLVSVSGICLWVQVEEAGPHPLP